MIKIFLNKQKLEQFYKKTTHEHFFETKLLFWTIIIIPNTLSPNKILTNISTTEIYPLSVGASVNVSYEAIRAFGREEVIKNAKHIAKSKLLQEMEKSGVIKWAEKNNDASLCKGISAEITAFPFTYTEEREH